MNPSSSRVPATQIDVRIDRHTRLPGRVWCAERPRALIAIAHGLGEHCGRYAALAAELVARRFTVVSLDLPGHGEAPGRRGDIGSWEQVRDLAIPAMFTVPRGMPGQPPSLPIVLLGHSLGGLFALDYALAHPKELLGVVASAPSLKGMPVPRLKLMLGQVAKTLAPGTQFPHGLPEDAMSRDPEVLALRASDPLIHDRITPRFYFALEEARRRVLEGARRLTVPALLLQGSADRVVDPRGTLEFNVAAPHGLVRLLTYRDAYHEVFNDPARDRAIRDLVGWLDALVVV